MNVTGTVINLPDGKVQIYATGEPMILEKFVSMIYGCPRAIIRDVRTLDMPLKNFDGFTIIKGENRISNGL